MNNKAFVFLIISLFAGIICFMAIDNIFVSVGVLVLYLIVSFLVLIPMLNKYQVKVKKFHECYHFINSFIISLSIKKSIPGALEATVNSMPNEFIDLYNGLENLSNNERLNYLATYFPFYVYSLFLQIVSIWEDEGGDILEMSKYLVAEIRSNEEYINKTDAMSSHKYIEIGVLWAFCMAILIILRFALNDFYTKIKVQLLYIISIAIIFGFVLFTIFLLVKKGTTIQIKGYSENEKNT